MPKIIKPRPREEVAFFFMAVENGRWQNTLPVCCERLGNISQPTLKTWTRLYNMPDRGRGTSLVPNCKDCDYKVTECVCDDIKKGRIAHG